MVYKRKMKGAKLRLYMSQKKKSVTKANGRLGQARETESRIRIAVSIGDSGQPGKIIHVKTARVLRARDENRGEREISFVRVQWKTSAPKIRNQSGSHTSSHVRRAVRGELKGTSKRAYHRNVRGNVVLNAKTKTSPMRDEKENEKGKRRLSMKINIGTEKKN